MQTSPSSEIDQTSKIQFFGHTAPRSVTVNQLQRMQLLHQRKGVPVQQHQKVTGEKVKEHKG